MIKISHKHVKIYNYAMKQLEKVKNQDDRINNLFMLILSLIWRMSLNGKYLTTILEQIRTFDYEGTFKEEEKDGEVC